MNIYKVKDHVLKRTTRRVFTYNMLSILLQIKKNNLRVIVNRMQNKGLIRILRDRIIFTDNEFIIANQLIQPSYFSIKTALYLQNLILQVPFTLESVNPINTFKINNYKYYKLNPTLFFGYKKKIIEDSYIFLATPEKAVLDGLYLNQMSESLIKEILSKLNKKQLLFLARKMKETKIRGTKKLFDTVNELVK